MATALLITTAHYSNFELTKQWFSELGIGKTAGLFRISFIIISIGIFPSMLLLGQRLKKIGLAIICLVNWMALLSIGIYPMIKISPTQFTEHNISVILFFGTFLILILASVLKSTPRHWMFYTSLVAIILMGAYYIVSATSDSIMAQKIAILACAVYYPSIIIWVTGPNPD